MRPLSRRARVRAFICTCFSFLCLPFAAWGQSPAPTAPAFDPKAWLLPLNDEAIMTSDAQGLLTVTWTPTSDSSVLRLTNDPLKFFGEPGEPHTVGKDARTVIIGDRDKNVRWYGIITLRGGANDGKKITVAERRLPLSGAANFRDIGGYRTADGRQVRWGRLYRAEALATLTDADNAYLKGLCLKTLCDFRGITEAEAAPDRISVGDTLSVVRLPIEAGSGKQDMASILGVALKGDRAALDETLSALYIRMVEEHGKDAFGPFVARAADPANLPLLYHCTAGKDRTGIATALILRTLGVPEKTVLADYSQSNLAYDSLMVQVKANKQLAAMGISPERLGPLMGVNPVWLEKTLRHIETKYGSVENYLTGPCGLDKKTLDNLRSNLLM